MADAIEKKNDSARNKAYAAANARLRDEFRERFNDLLTEEYAALGLTPRRRRTAEEIEAEAAAKEQVRREKAEMKRLQKIAALQAQIEELEAAEAAAAAPVVEGDPMDVFREPASV